MREEKEEYDDDDVDRYANILLFLYNISINNKF